MTAHPQFEFSTRIDQVERDNDESKEKRKWQQTETKPKNNSGHLITVPLPHVPFQWAYLPAIESSFNARKIERYHNFQKDTKIHFIENDSPFSPSHSRAPWMTYIFHSTGDFQHHFTKNDSSNTCWAAQINKSCCTSIVTMLQKTKSFYPLYHFPYHHHHHHHSSLLFRFRWSRNRVTTGAGRAKVRYDLRKTVSICTDP